MVATVAAATAAAAMIVSASGRSSPGKAASFVTLRHLGTGWRSQHSQRRCARTVTVAASSAFGNDLPGSSFVDFGRARYESSSESAFRIQTATFGSLSPKQQRRRSLSALAAHRGGGSVDEETSDDPFDLPPPFQKRSRTTTTAISAVLSACRVTRAVQPTTPDDIRTLSKADASPVTVGDFASQAVVLQQLREAFPEDLLVAEEGSDALRGDEDLCRRVLEAVRLGGSGNGGGGEVSQWKDEDVWNAIDLGRHDIPDTSSPAMDDDGDATSTTTVAKKRRVWCLDPIDGTKGFLRGRYAGGQYCVALALIEDGIPVVGVLGCPNLPVFDNDDETNDAKTAVGSQAAYGEWSEEDIQADHHDDAESKSPFLPDRGCLFVAVRGCGCYKIPLHALSSNNGDVNVNIDAWEKLRVTPNDGSSIPPAEGTFCLGVERGFSDPAGTVLQMAEVVQGPDALTDEDDDGFRDIRRSLRMDGQGKYGLLAGGRAEYFCRLPKDGYVDWVWDVAAGYVVLTEAGGTLTDVNGQDIDFTGVGLDGNAKLPEHVRGLIGSNGGVFHETLVKAYWATQGMKTPW